MLARESVNISVVLEEEYPSVIVLDLFKGFARLLRVAGMVFKFINILRGLEEDCEMKVEIYLMNLLQRYAFAEELESPGNRCLVWFQHCISSSIRIG